MEEDVAKAKRLWQSMNEVSGEEKPFPVEQVESALSLLAEQMAHEDPDHLIPCSCCGAMWPSRDVDMWGLCPIYSQKGKS